MLAVHSLFALVAAAVVSATRGQPLSPNPAGAWLSFPTPYSLNEKFIGNDFFKGFNWETIDDPTHGRVNYVSQADSRQKGLVTATAHNFVMRADSTSVLTNDTLRGRDSVRIVSKNGYKDSVLVMDLTHMPEGCATWPAFWTLPLTKPWPTGGEIDIIEGVNLNTANLASLHTSANCTMPETTLQTGTVVSTNCDVAANFNQGCGSNFRKPGSYGSALNKAGGGWFVLVKSQERGAAVYFWPRNDPTVPPAIKFGLPVVVPDATWGLPEVLFPSTDTCDFNAHFDAPHNIIINLTFCGDWAGQPTVFGTTGCSPLSCADCGSLLLAFLPPRRIVDLNNSLVVDQTPEAFANAYWDIQSLRVYTPISH